MILSKSSSSIASVYLQSWPGQNRNPSPHFFATTTRTESAALAAGCSNPDIESRIRSVGGKAGIRSIPGFRRFFRLLSLFGFR
jgi:hypothetical protein